MKKITFCLSHSFIRLSYLFVALFVLFSFSGCEDIFKKEIPLKFSGDTDSRIVANGLLTVGNPVEIFISRSRPADYKVLDKDAGAAFALDKAKVRWIQDGKVLDERTLVKGVDVYPITNPKPGSNTIYSGSSDRLSMAKHQLYYAPDLSPSPGTEVVIEIESEGLPKATIKLHFPEPSDLEVVEVKAVPDMKNPYKDGDTVKTYYNYKVRVQDPLYKTPRYYGMDQLFLLFNKEDELQHELFFGEPFFIEQDPIFSREAIAIMRYRISESWRFSSGYSPHVVPFFSTEQFKSDSYVLNLIGRDPALDDPERNGFENFLVLYALDPFYYRLAATKYGLEVAISETEEGFSVDDVHGSPISEKRPTMTNVEGGRGVVLARTPMVVHLISNH